MADNNNQPKVINKSGTLKMTDETAATRKSRDIGGRPFDRRNNRRRGGVRADVAPKEYDEVTINIDRVSRTVAGGRRMRFKALVAIGNHKNKIGVGVAKGNDVTSAVQKATAKAKKSIVEFAMDGETICHEVETKETGAHVLMKPAAPGTGIIGSLMTLMAIDGDRYLYYYSQEPMPTLNSDEEKRTFRERQVLPVDKSKVPLQALLSQALEKQDK